MSFIPQSDSKITAKGTHGKVSSIEFLNAHMDTLLLAGYDDGYIRVWSQPTNNGTDGILLTSWQALGDNSLGNKLSNKLTKSNLITYYFN